jgi:hypothetical protein
MSILDYVVLGGLAIAVICIVVGILRGKRRCKGGCGNCPYSGHCGDFQEKRQGRP